MMHVAIIVSLVLNYLRKRMLKPDMKKVRLNNSEDKHRVTLSNKK